MFVAASTFRMMELEERIERDSNALVRKKIQLNTYAFISRLPPELLAEIFVIYVDIQPAPDPPSCPPLSPYAWIRVTHVCHVWREIALSFPSLWRNITHRWRTKEDCILAMLERAHRCHHLALSIHIPSTPRISPAMDAMFAQLGRARVLDLQIPLPAFPKSLGLSPVEWPHLTTLILCHKARPVLCKMPALLAVRRMPRLHTVVLRGFDIKWTHPILRRPLISLSFHGSVVPDTFNALQGMPKLRSLSLSGTFRLLPDEGNVETLPEVRERVDLPCLEYLQLTGCSRQVAYFINHLNLPDSADVSIELCEDSRARDIRHVASVIASRVNRVEKSLETGYLVFGAIHKRYCIDLHVRPVLPDAMSTSQSRPFLRTSSTTEINGAYLIIEPFLELFPLAHMSSVCLGPLGRTAPSFKTCITKILKQMPNLSTLHVIDQQRFSVVDQVLKTRVEDLTAPRKTRRKLQWIVPHLRTLIVQNMLFSSDSASHVGAFRSRASAGVGLQRLVLRNGVGLNGSLVESIRDEDIAQMVEWDGIQASVRVPGLPPPTAPESNVEMASEEEDD